MSAPAPRPLLFLDVDGTLIPLGTPTAAQPGMPHSHTEAPALPADAHPLLHKVNPEHGRRLEALPCDLVRATTWMSDAIDVLAPLLGLPTLPVADWPDSDEMGALTGRPAGSSSGRRDAPSSGSTTKSPTPISSGCRLITTARPCCIESIPVVD
ncbi:hypothetical protein ACFW0V_20295 [Micromonospora parva]|uniref:hypothetical protein n=1 Tax=Micromonospora parva TaxID=1464048 RepID=UPI0036724D79